MYKMCFLTDIRNKITTCYTFSVRPTIPESKNIKVVMKEIDEGENEDFKKSISFFRTLFSVKKKDFKKTFAQMIFGKFL